MMKALQEIAPVLVVIVTVCVGMTVPLDVWAAPGAHAAHGPNTPAENGKEQSERACENGEEATMPPRTLTELAYDEDVLGYWGEVCEEEEGSGDGNPAIYP